VLQRFSFMSSLCSQVEFFCWMRRLVGLACLG
jgi:hypothetical protein